MRAMLISSYLVISQLSASLLLLLRNHLTQSETLIRGWIEEPGWCRRGWERPMRSLPFCLSWQCVSHATLHPPFFTLLKAILFLPFIASTTAHLPLLSYRFLSRNETKLEKKQKVHSLLCIAELNYFCNLGISNRAFSESIFIWA